MEHIIQPENDLVLIGVCGERFDIPEFEASKDAILARSSSHVKQLHTARGHRVDRNRDEIVLTFLNAPYKPDWLLFLDSDMTFPDDIVYRLMSHRLPIVGGLYFHREKNVPFVFRRGQKQRDKWGRLIDTHEYMADEVYDFLQRAGVENRDQPVAIDGVDGRMQECDAVATGAMMIHRSVFEKMKGPWFEYPGGAISEDIAFCDRVTSELGFPVYADLGTVCGHLSLSAKGYAQFRAQFATRGLKATNYDFVDAVAMLSMFERMDIEKAEKKLVEYSPHLLADHWLDMMDDPGVRDIDFYTSARTGELYLRELLHWNASPTFAKFRTSLVGLEEKRVLEIGSGIGSITIQLAAQRCDVDAFEANPKLRQFSRKRLKYLIENDKIPNRMGNIKWKGAFRPGAKLPAKPGEYDLVVAIDVLEHMDERTLRSVMSYCSMYMKPGARMYVHNAWGDKTSEGIHPFHYDHEDIWKEVLHENNMFQLAPSWIVKEF